MHVHNFCNSQTNLDEKTKLPLEKIKQHLSDVIMKKKKRIFSHRRPPPHKQTKSLQYTNKTTNMLTFARLDGSIGNGGAK